MKVQFDKEKLMVLLRHYHTITGMRVGIYDLHFSEICAYPVGHSGFCRLIRSTQAGLNSCRLCDAAAFAQAKQQRKLLIYRCHAGLTEVIAPVFGQDQVIGYLMLGQMRTYNDSEKQWWQLKQSLLKEQMEIDYLKSVFLKMKSVSDKEIESYAYILQACASYIWMDQTIRLQQEELSSRLEQYIERHLDGDLCLPSLAQELDVGKTTLYHCSKEYFGIAPGKLVQKKRLDKAKQLLLQSDCSIAEIAAQVGIPDYNYFAKLFRWQEGMSPSKYRRRSFTEP